MFDDRSIDAKHIGWILDKYLRDDYRKQELDSLKKTYLKGGFVWDYGQSLSQKEISSLELNQIDLSRGLNFLENVFICDASDQAVRNFHSINLYLECVKNMYVDSPSKKYEDFVSTFHKIFCTVNPIIKIFKTFSPSELVAIVSHTERSCNAVSLVVKADAKKSFAALIRKRMELGLMPLDAEVRELSVDAFVKAYGVYRKGVNGYRSDILFAENNLPAGITKNVVMNYIERHYSDTESYLSR